jgi:putative DNA primase/helicase
MTDATNSCTLKAYAKAKKLPEEFLIALGITEVSYHGRPALRIPYYDDSGAAQAIRLRTALVKAGPKTKCFCWEIGGQPSLYGIPQRRPGTIVTLVEGESDTHTLLLHGINVLGIPGASCWNDERDARHLQSYEIIFLVKEPDAGGGALLKALSKSSLRKRIRVVRLDGFKDVSEMHVDDPKRFDERWQTALDASVPLDEPPSGDVGAPQAPASSFEMTEDGLFVEVHHRKGSERRWLSASFELFGRSRDPNSNGWGHLLHFADDDGCLHEYVVTDAALHGDPGALCSDLASRGLRITTTRDRSRFVHYLNEVRVPARVTRLRETGWQIVKGELTFVHPFAPLGGPTGEIIRFEGAATSAYEQSGSLDEWTATVGALVAQHSRLRLACSVAFAGPLLYLVGLEGGGLHLHGSSTSGKTTGACAAASVWGKGSTDGYVLPWRHTANALEAILAGRTDTLVVLDELGASDAKSVFSALYQITARTGKSRLTRDVRLRDAVKWRNIILSTGEVPIGTKIAEDHGRLHYAGQQVRVLDLPADAGSGVGIFDASALQGEPGEVADRLKAAAARYYGGAGPEFVRRLIAEGPDEVGSLVGEMITIFEKAQIPAGANGQVRRAARLLGLIGAAGELATRWGIVPWQDGAAIDAAAKALADWIAQRGGLGAAEIRDGIEQVRRYFAQFGESRFDDVGNADARMATTRAGWRRRSGEDREWLIIPSVWRDEICKGRDATAIARALAEQGTLVRDSQDKLQRCERTPMGSMRVHVLKASILRAEDDER